MVMIRDNTELRNTCSFTVNEARNPKTAALIHLRQAIELLRAEKEKRAPLRLFSTDVLACIRGTLFNGPAGSLIGEDDLPEQVSTDVTMPEAVMVIELPKEVRGIQSVDFIVHTADRNGLVVKRFFDDTGINFSVGIEPDYTLGKSFVLIHCEGEDYPPFPQELIEYIKDFCGKDVSTPTDLEMATARDFTAACNLVSAFATAEKDKLLTPEMMVALDKLSKCNRLVKQAMVKQGVVIEISDRDIRFHRVETTKYEL